MFTLIQNKTFPNEANAFQPDLDNERKKIISCFMYSLNLTFTGAALTYESHHEGSALVTLGGGVEGLHHELMCFGLRSENM